MYILCGNVLGVVLNITICMKMVVLLKGMMMAKFFKKYPSLVNHYRADDIHYWLSINPELAQATYAIQEKIHGANISFYISPDETPVMACSRNRVLSPDENFYGLPTVRQLYVAEFMRMKEYAKKYKQVIRVYGEFFGGDIQQGVDYGRDKRILFFDAKIDGTWLTVEEFDAFFEDDLVLPYLTVPKLAIVRTLAEALHFPTEVNSVLNFVYEGENIMEGVVIKPYKLVQVSKEGSKFAIKKKNDAFKEKVHREKPPPDIDQSLLDLQEEFNTYLTDMRLQCIFSKFGMIWRPSQIGEYIKYMIDDAMEDFFADNPSVKELSKKSRKTIFRTAGKSIMHILKKAMEGNAGCMQRQR
jgi:Rnl2 family RNA ligase